MPGDLIYMFSDGYADQFGGPDNKKFKYSSLKLFWLKSISSRCKSKNKDLKNEFIEWKGDSDQTDDVLIIGFRV